MQSSVQHHMHRHLTGTASPCQAVHPEERALAAEEQDLCSPVTSSSHPSSVHPSPMLCCWRQGDIPLLTVTSLASWFHPVCYHQGSSQINYYFLTEKNQERALGSSETCLSNLKTLVSTGFCFYYSHYSKSFKQVIFTVLVHDTFCATFAPSQQVLFLYQF